jgi:hypothetical protein
MNKAESVLQKNIIYADCDRLYTILNMTFLLQPESWLM